MSNEGMQAGRIYRPALLIPAVMQKEMRALPILKLDFNGPYSFMKPGNYLFDAPCASSAGVYLWTIRQRRDNSHLIHYVGETVSFAKRQREHLIHILGLNYGILDAEKAQEGIFELVWPGLWRNKSSNGPLLQIEAYQSLHKMVLKYVAILNVFFAEINTETQLRRHIEGCIGWNLRNNHSEKKVLYPDDNHVGIKQERNHGELFISSSENIQGLDTYIKY